MLWRPAGESLIDNFPIPTYVLTLDELRILDQVEELRGCDQRLTACMLNRLGDLRR